MNIGFFTEGSYEGKVPRNHPNMRTDLAWVCATNGTHHPMITLHQLPDNLYDLGIMIIPKKRRPLLQYDLLSNYKRVCKKVSIMQESTYNYWQDDPLDEQVWYYNLLTEMDLIFCHNYVDVRYYNGITSVRTELLPSLMLTDNLNLPEVKRDGVIIGGNFVSIYGGFDSYQVALSISDDVTAPTTGRMKQEETQILNHIPWVLWNEWMEKLNHFYAGVQLGTPAAGTFNMNCSYLGIPCVGYSNLNTQSLLHPNTTVKLGDIVSAKNIAKKLKNDKDFYQTCSEETKLLFDKKYSERAFVNHMKDIFKTL